CPTCRMVEPVLAQLDADPHVELTVYTQDDASFPSGVGKVVLDEDLAVSYHHGIETVPTLLRVEGGVERDRTVGWSRAQWTACTGVDGLGQELPDMRPGCGSLSVDPTMVDELRVRFEGHRLAARRVQVGALEDEIETMFERGWSDGLPLVPPTEARVLRMLEGTTRAPGDVVAVVPPDLVECTVEKIAINAVLAGCKPEYLPVVIAGVEAACTDEFNIHGLLATTMPVGPVMIVNGPVRARIGMNAGVNVLGEGNRVGHQRSPPAHGARRVEGAHRVLEMEQEASQVHEVERAQLDRVQVVHAQLVPGDLRAQRRLRQLEPLAAGLALADGADGVG